MFLIGGKRIKEDELDYIRHLYQYPENSTVKSVMGHLGLSRRAYYYRKNKAGITKKHIRAWSDKEIDFIKRTYNTLTIQEQANLLSRTVSAVKNKRAVLIGIYTITELIMLNAMGRMFGGMT